MVLAAFLSVSHLYTFSSFLDLMNTEKEGQAFFVNYYLISSSISVHCRIASGVVPEKAE